MATELTTQTAFFNLPLSIKRLNPRPLDPTEVWTSLNDAKEYASNGANAFVGQMISVVTKENEATVAKAYLIKNIAGELEPIGGLSTDANGNTVLDKVIINGDAIFNSKLSLVSNGKTYNIALDTDGKLNLGGNVDVSGILTAVNGFSLGIGGNVVLQPIEIKDSNNNVTARMLHSFGNIDLEAGCGIMVDGKYIIDNSSSQYVTISAPGKTLNIGGGTTSGISLQSDLYNDNHDYKIISKYGDGSFLNSFEAGYSRSVALIKTYKTSNSDLGVVIPKTLRFGTISGPSLYSDNGIITLKTDFSYLNSSSTTVKASKIIQIQYGLSNSMYAVLNKDCFDLNIITDADFLVSNKPIEGKNSIGISGSKTRITDNQLFFNDGIYMIALSDGIKHYGNSYFNGNIGSVTYSSGFSGSGWRIDKNELTGNITGTFDEVVIRKKLRAYEYEVQKSSVTNGSLWISDSCIGDTVTEL